MPRFSRFYALYSGAPSAGRKYRQILAGLSDDGTFYEVHIFEGEGTLIEPHLSKKGSAAGCHSHDTKEAADKHADEERDRSLAAGWILYDPKHNIS